MRVDHTTNSMVLAYLSRSKPDVPSYAARDAIADPYLRAGCHPDIVERLWDQLGATLPCDCRCLIYGTPALAIPSNGIILGIGMGTQYGLYLPSPLADEAIAAGARTSTVWGVRDTMSITSELGPDWVFGAWLPSESNWCNAAYAALRGVA
jgi:hypothetical protein